MQSIMDRGGQPGLAFSPQERTEQVQGMGARQMAYALTYLSGFAPAVFEAVVGVTLFEPVDDILNDGEWRAAFFGEAQLGEVTPAG